MNRDQAKQLLERLRMRTEARGATAAEAAQAADLAEKIIRRYGLDQETDPHAPQQADVETGQRRVPVWAIALAMGIEKRFHVASYIRKHGEQRGNVVFEGPEHRVRVACWLFRAVATDLRRACDRSAREHGRAGPALVRFRNQYLSAAAWEVYERLNPERVAEMRRKIAEQAEQVARGERPPSKPVKFSKRALQAASRFDRDADRCGMAAGREVSIDANVLSEPRQPAAVLAIEHQARRKQQAALF